MAFDITAHYQPCDAEGPVFREPWEAKAFGLTIKLYESGAFTWPEWTDALGAEISGAKERGEIDLGDNYYHYWLRALEFLVIDKGFETISSIDSRVQIWRNAYLAPRHGCPVELDAGLDLLPTSHE